MALDAQTNWNVEMSQPLRITFQPVQADNSVATANPFDPLSMPSKHSNSSHEAPVLPQEIISQILEYLPRDESLQRSLWACALVSRSWYHSTIELLYERPLLNGGSFNSFAQTICPSKNAHITPSTLSVLVKVLDMSRLVHNASRSLTARLLGRLKGNLEEFMAPQSSFGINSLAALSKCTKLKILNLSLVSASIPLKQFFRTVKSLIRLEILFFPRSSRSDPSETKEVYEWPPRLKALHLAGGIDDNFIIDQMVNVPDCLQKLSIQHCTQVHAYSLLSSLEIIGPRLRELTIRYPMPKLELGSLDRLLLICPTLIALRLFAEYITNGLISSVGKHPLRILDVETTHSYLAEHPLSPGTLYELAECGNLADLRVVRVSARLGWRKTANGLRDIEDLKEVMKDNDNVNPLGLRSGIWHLD